MLWEECDESDAGGDSSAVQKKLKDQVVKTIYSTDSAFAGGDERGKQALGLRDISKAILAFGSNLNYLGRPRYKSKRDMCFLLLNTR